jgi:GT2 family glycosyltransferase
VPIVGPETADNERSEKHQQSKPLVWALILHWRSLERTRACLQSLRSVTFDNLKVLLIDNGSEGKDTSALSKEFPEVSIVRLEENHGFAGGCNVGINCCLNNGAQFIWLLNNDAVVAPNCLDLLVETAAQNERIAACGAAMSSVPSHLIEDGIGTAGRGIIDFRRAKTFLKPDLPTSPVECDWLCGASLLLRVEALKQAGNFDERYFLYFEDTELCARLRKHGWKCVLVPEAKIEHAGGSSTAGNLEYWRAYYYTRNRLLFFLTYCPPLLRFLAIPSIVAHITRHIFVLPFRGREARNKLRAELLGLSDFLQRRFGKAQCLDWCEREE